MQLAHDRKVLVAQVVASYEAPPPDIATVILEAHGFADLIERVNDLRAISRENASATTQVAQAQKAVTAQAKHLAALEVTHSSETHSVLVQRDEVAQLRLALVKRQLAFVSARSRKSAELEELQSHKHSLEHELAHVQARELAASGRHLLRADRRIQLDARRRLRLLPRRRHQLLASATSRRSPSA